MEKLYSYNQLLSLYGENDKQVMMIKSCSAIVSCDTNKSLEAFKRIN